VSVGDNCRKRRRLPARARGALGGPIGTARSGSKDPRRRGPGPRTRAEDRRSTGVGGRHANGRRSGGDVDSAFFRTGSERVAICVHAGPPFAGVEVEVGEPKVAWGRGWHWSGALARGGRCRERRRFGEEVAGGAVVDVVAGVGVVVAEEVIGVVGIAVVAVVVEAITRTRRICTYSRWICWRKR